MADDVQTLRSLNWRALFPFLNLFDAFKVAMHPSKLALGFLLLMFLYGGGRVLDLFWPTKSLACFNEIDDYDRFRWARDSSESFNDFRDSSKALYAGRYAELLRGRNIISDEATAVEAGYVGDYRGQLMSAIIQDRNTAIEKARTGLADELKKIDEARAPANADTKTVEFDKSKEKQLRRDQTDHAIRDAQSVATRSIQMLQENSPQPIFSTFLDFEVRQFHNIIGNALSWDWINGGTANGAERVETIGELPQQGSIEPSGSVFRSLINFAIIGPSWLVRYHPVFFVLFIGWFLVIWAIFGGAISRIAAVHVALDEKMSIRKALRFSTGKLLSFVFAPLIPLMFVLVMGLILAAGGLLMYVSVAGPIVLSAFFVLALFAGFLITLALAGNLGGSGLMYPTIAVEGSDSFDAISKSCSYVFMRPWKMLFYTGVAVVYGAICYLFVRFFIFVVLAITHFFTSWFLFGKPGQYWPEIWPPVTYENLSYQVNFQSLAWSERISAGLIQMWVYLLLAVLAAFVISFYFSANTIIYYLMRSEIDTNELSEVYLEEGDEDDWGEPATPPAEASTEAAVKA